MQKRDRNLPAKTAVIWSILHIFQLSQRDESFYIQMVQTTHFTDAHSPISFLSGQCPNENQNFWT